MTSDTATAAAREPSALRKVLQPVVAMSIWTSGMFFGARRLDWPRGWVAVAIYVCSITCVGVVMRRSSPGLAGERMKGARKDTKPYDKVFLPAIMLLGTVQPLVAGWEAGCAQCRTLSFGWVYAGAAICILSFLLVAWVMAVNRHAETSVRIQTDRGHTVISTGPYRFVRHPMYVGCTLMFAGFPLVWGATKWTWYISAALAAIFIARTALEDRTLRAELPGYAQYAADTRYRLIPGVW
jgi:protein-S-isoprenylcysteine O-methyltransferase Ste14